MGEIKAVIEELNSLYEKTGVRLDSFWDITYSPTLLNEKTGEKVYLLFDEDNNKYVGKEEDPFDGNII